MPLIGARRRRGAGGSAGCRSAARRRGRGRSVLVAPRGASGRARAPARAPIRAVLADRTLAAWLAAELAANAARAGTLVYSGAAVRGVVRDLDRADRLPARRRSVRLRGREPCRPATRGHRPGRGPARQRSPWLLAREHRRLRRGAPRPPLPSTLLLLTRPAVVGRCPDAALERPSRSPRAAGGPARPSRRPAGDHDAASATSVRRPAQRARHSRPPATPGFGAAMGLFFLTAAVVLAQPRRAAGGRAVALGAGG